MKHESLYHMKEKEKCVQMVPQLSFRENTVDRLVQEVFLVRQVGFRELGCDRFTSGSGGAAQDADTNKEMIGNSLFGHSHEILGAEVCTESVEEVIIGRVGVQARPSERVDARRHRECRHRPLRNRRGERSDGCSVTMKGRVIKTPSTHTPEATSKHVHIRHHGVPWRLHHPVDATRAPIHHTRLHHSAVVRSCGRSSRREAHERKLRRAKGAGGHRDLVRQVAVGLLTSAQAQIRVRAVVVRDVGVAVEVASLGALVIVAG